jgi:hypothetical protein
MLNLKPVRIGLILALFSILFGYLFGIAFGAWETAMKADLRAAGESVLATVYQGDETKLEGVLLKAWAYYIRAHLHAGALGASAVAQILLLSVLAATPRWKSGVAFLLGAGALGYGVFWMLAAQRAPLVGGTDIARESLDWLAMPTSGACLIGTLLILFFTVRTVFSKRG